MPVSEALRKCGLTETQKVQQGAWLARIDGLMCHIKTQDRLKSGNADTWGINEQVWVCGRPGGKLLEVNKLCRG
jgi:hypothetical protein